MYKLPQLAYAYSALEPFIDEETMKIHHSKHHQGYTDKLNKALEGVDAEDNIIDLLKNISKYNDDIRNNAGGFYNHSLFWDILTPQKTKLTDKKLEDAINTYFRSMDSFKARFTEEATSRFGSGWAWLCKKDDGGLFIMSTPNQDNPLMDIVKENGIPILGIDVWEHAYYLNYQNKRQDYIDAFFEIINWDKVADLYNDKD